MSKLSQWKNRDKPLTIPARQGKASLSLSQKGMLLMQSLAETPLLYQYGHRFTFSEPLDRQMIEDRINKTIQRHSALRSNYSLKDGLAKVQLTEKVSFTLEHENTSEKDFFERPFDLGKDLLIRGMLVGNKTLALSIHHIIGDRQSLDLLFSNVFTNEVDPIKPLDYFDFTEWYNKHINKDAQTTYWKERLRGELPTLNLPHDFLRPSNSRYLGHSISKRTSIKTLENLASLSKRSQCTKFAIVAAVYNIYLHLYSGQSDILIGTPVVARSKKELANVIGYFNETLVLRNSISGATPFIDFLDQVNRNFLKDFEQKDISFDHLVETIRPPRGSSAHPIFQTMLLYNKDRNHSAENQDVISEMVDLGISKFDITLFVEEFDTNLSLRLEYSSELFKKSTAMRMLDDFIEILNQLTASPEKKISEITFQSAYRHIKPPSTLDITEDSILDLINFSANGTAVKFENELISYQQLDRKSDKVAACLVSKGVKVNDFVGLYCGRSLEMIVGILSILKAGAAYIPLDQKYPKERIHHMLKDSGAEYVLFHELKIEGGHKNIDIEKALLYEDQIILPSLASTQNAYMIYTSGSTGQPKGVPITHKNLITSTKSRFSFYDEKVACFLLLSSFSFDSSIAGIFWTLTSGGSLLLSQERAEQNVEDLCTLIHKEGVTHTLLLPSLYQIILKLANKNLLGSLRNVIVAGEACSSEVVASHFSTLEACKLYNEYGPTEATVWSIAHKVEAGCESSLIPIGQSIPYYSNFILNKYLKPQPTGVEGEIYISGQGLSEGYWKNEELSDEKFILHPEFGRLYKTGDLAKYNEDGNIIFKGRKDKQIKILGHRVELDEIRNKVLTLSEVAEAVVIVKEDKIIVFYTGAEIPMNEADLGLPAYMTPNNFILLDDFPTLPNGKVDLKKVNKFANSSKIRNNEIITPSSGNEVILHDIWSDVLGLDAISIDDNFFDLGGTSLKSIQILSRAKDKGIELSPSQIFEYQTIRKLAKSAENPIDNSSEILVTFRKTGSKPPLFCIHGGGGHVFFYKEFAEKLPLEIPVYSFQPEGLGGKVQVAESIEAMASSYINEMRKVQAHGPYQILGTCFSNSVAIEMAKQLNSQGEVLLNLFIIDSAPVHLFGNNAGREKQTLKRFLDMLFRGDFKRIQSKIRSRFFGKKRLTGDLELAVSEDKNLARIIAGMNKMYANYNWEAYSGKIEFIRSSEFNARKDKDYHLVQWQKLAKKGIHISVVEGHHISLFETPEVSNLANKVGEIILES